MCRLLLKHLQYYKDEAVGYSTIRMKLSGKYSNYCVCIVTEKQEKVVLRCVCSL